LLPVSYNGAVARGQAQWHARHVRYARWRSGIRSGHPAAI